MKKPKPYYFRLLLAIDQLFNVLILNGSEDHTISGHVGYKAIYCGNWYWLVAEKIINAIFFFDKDHCFTSIEWDEV